MGKCWMELPVSESRRLLEGDTDAMTISPLSSFPEHAAGGYNICGVYRERRFLTVKKDAVKETIRPETAKKRLCLYKHGKAGWYRGIISSLQRKLQGLFIFIRKVFLLNINRSAEYRLQRSAMRDKAGKYLCKWEKR